MKALPHPRGGAGAAVLGVLAFTTLEMTVLATAPAAYRPVISGALLGAAVTAFALLAAVLRADRRATRQARRRALELMDESSFTAHALEGFPMEAVRPRLLGPNAPSLNHLYTAWAFAARGHDTAWLVRHLDLPAPLARLLTDAAAARLRD
ncbi:hypothetical protein ABZ723_30945 [Streptomyces sp. NPDC006700]|uniref:hypothetical protein n=1 Tax=Streptomyces sp. NPDC006700 TaxID=3154479 RepID=UPI0033FBBDE9